MATLQEQAKTINDLIDQANQAIDNGDVDKAKEFQQEIEQAQIAYQEQKELEESIHGLEKVGESDKSDSTGSGDEKTETEEKNEKPDKPTDEEKAQAKKETEESDGVETDSLTEEPSDEDIEEPTPEELEEAKKKKEKQGGKRDNMAKQILEDQQNKLSEEAQGFMNYIKSKGAQRDNVKSVDAQPIIPEDIKHKTIKLPETVVDLKQFVNVTPVKNPQGSQPILNAAQETMVSVEELAKNPELASPTFDEVNYKVQTYRGQIPVSEEALDDSEENLANLIANNNKRQELNTTNKHIADVMKSFAKLDVKDADALKHLLNVEIDPAYNVSFVVTQSFYHAIDTLKDNEGRYLFQQDIKSPSGSVLLGKPVFIVKDEELGVKGDKKAFVGDLYYAIFFADRKQASVKWRDHEIYGQILANYMRFDVVKAVDEAGRFITWTGETSESSESGNDTSTPEA